MIRYYKNKTVGFQLRAVMAICLLIAFSSIAALVYHNASRILLDATLKEQQSKVDAMAKTISGQFDAYLETAQVLESTFQHGYLNGTSMQSSSVEFQGHEVNDIVQNGVSLINNNTVVDSFTRDTGAVATIFASANDDWLRVATSLKDHSGKRVIGTLLGRDHPGYQKLMSGQPYYAQVTLFGQRYITYYAPIKNHNGELIAISFIGLPVEKAAQDIFDTLKAVAWGDTGYTVVVDNSEDHRGQYLLHPTMANGSNSIVNTTDAQGNKPFSAIFQQASGLILYPSQTQNGISEKYMVYAEIPGWDWKLLGGTYTAEVTKASRDLLELIVLISALVAAATFAVVTLYIIRTTKPLTVLTGYMERLSQGEVSLSVAKGDAQSANEIVRLTNGVADMATQLHVLVSDIRGTSDKVHSQSGSVLSDARHNLRQADAQQQQVEQVVTAIEEMATSAQAVAQQVEAIAGNVREADLNTQSGLSVVEMVCIDVAQLNDQLDQSAAAINQVSDDSASIHAVTKMIDEIAEQTNLLALNAAIEAARAGEQGRGFAVVADEVRTLAHRTQVSVKDVVTIIDKLKDSTSNAVSLMKMSQHNANQVLDKAQEAGTSLESIADQIRDIAGQSDAIAATAEQQAQVSQEVAASAAQISQLNSESRDTTAQTSHSADELSQLASHLKQQVDFFH
ncbi:methyl-accepting chemotaxis protein [Vibrio fluvialis]|uniref:methyl-accepting chemotaxis protein n=1 Tax=Vibrio fluvialis TaxID=676 RepID=UPI00192B9956|nr:methyl-accepting chemotaxis protein [Vibrio fluvialis]MBL4282237.1 methyl-accepting chemotaxis protein [Vibrio fluvialis]